MTTTKDQDGSAAGPIDGPKVTLGTANVLRRLLRNPGDLGAALVPDHAGRRDVEPVRPQWVSVR